MASGRFDEGIGMNNIISEYQKWKQQGEDLRIKAKQAMESRFRELLAEAIQVAEEYRSDFGGSLKPPAAVTSFRYKSSGKPRPKKTQSPAAAKGAGTPPKAIAKTNPKTVGLQKRLAAAQQKLEQAKATGASTKNLEDRIYEIEDALRLSSLGS
jgi:small-conductance mechanosensitive channel